MKTTRLDAEKFEKEGDLVKALICWRALADASNSEEYYRRLGRVAQRLERWEEAEAAYLRAIQAGEPSALKFELMGSLWYRRTDKLDPGATEIAKEWFIKAIGLEKTARLYTELGAAYVVLRDINSAKEAFEKALELESTYEEAMYNLAVLLEIDNPEKAIRLLENALSEDPNYGVAHQLIGKLYQRSGDLVRAEYHFRRSLEIDQHDYWSALYLANNQAVQGLDKEATLAYEKAVAMEPDSEAGWNLFANFLDSIGSVDRSSEIRAAHGLK